ncbi:hypothetical protein TeGR_g10066 [Tetraparma gracilis]|uniref:Uncharacterized protein n=1 Tax=Tetraparma gracilis TaxID=2962635 RepID=A0ABQ6M5J2_9STRA|nr:hypothetical protein TeGR_g10066 [Tetraparma gracilis]
MGLFYEETQTDVLHDTCTPTGDADLSCGHFMKCYKYDDFYKDTNATRHAMHVDAGGICDCYNFWGYGHFPTCDEVSYPDSIINLMFLTIIPYMIMALGVIFTTKAIWELHQCDQFKMNVVGRGLLLNGLAAFFGTFWCVSCGLSIFSPIVDRRQWSTYYLFNMGMGSYTAVFVPAFLVLPICWIENVMASKKMKKKVNFQRSQTILRVSSVVVSLVIVVLQAMREYRISNAAVCFFLIASVAVYYRAAGEIIKYAGNMIPKGQRMAMTKTKYEVSVMAGLYLTFAVAYAATTNIRNWGTVRLPAVLVGLDMIVVGLIHLFLLRYLRYQCRKWIQPTFLLREEHFWAYLDAKTEKQKQVRATMSPSNTGVMSGGMSTTQHSYMSHADSPSEAEPTNPKDIESWKTKGGEERGDSEIRPSDASTSSKGAGLTNPIYKEHKKKFKKAQEERRTSRAGTKDAHIAL